eukprot:COSAG02_NODE_9958_length_2064_cov_1.501781_2_plen_138_part_01
MVRASQIAVPCRSTTQAADTLADFQCPCCAGLCLLLFVCTTHILSSLRPADAPQVRKTATAKAGSTQEFGEGVVFEIDRGTERKSFQSRLTRRQLIEFELVSSGWLKNEPIGTGTWGGLGGLMQECEIEGQVKIKDAD